MEIRVAAVEHYRYEDGPGVRTTIFLQGCNRGCLNCHNKEIWDINKGNTIEIKELISNISDYNFTKKVTISGGEPLMQIKELKELIFLLYKEGYDIGLYTSYEFEEIPKDILKYLTFVKVGKYVEKLKIENKYYGSSNQKILFLYKGEIKNEN